MNKNSENTTLQIHDIDFANGAVLNINKPVDWTSFDVVKKIRNLTRVKKVGHAGTLDPFATGVLIVCTGPATKRINKFVEDKKEYIGEIFLGTETDTYDSTGEIVKQYEGQDFPDTSIVEEIINSYKGQIEQVPPMFSALKVKGKRLYKYAREGKTVERKARKIEIFEIELLLYKYPLIKVRIVCSKGTYIRSLAFDIGRDLGTGAHLKNLIRTRIGDFILEDAWDMDEFVNLIHEVELCQ